MLPHTYTQTNKEVVLFLPLAADVRAKEVQFKCTSQQLSLSVRGVELKGEFFLAVKPDESTWELEDEPAETRPLGEIAIQDAPDLPAVQRRLRQGADPNDPAEFRFGWAPLYWVAARGHVQVVEALADAGADLGWKGGGATALHFAANNGHAGAVRSLLAARGGQAAVDARDNDNETPLHRAAYHSHTAAVQELLEAGADASLKSNRGQTALELAVSKGRHEVAALLR